MKNNFRGDLRCLVTPENMFTDVSAKKALYGVGTYEQVSSCVYNTSYLADMIWAIGIACGTMKSLISHRQCRVYKRTYLSTFNFLPVIVL